MGESAIDPPGAQSRYSIVAGDGSNVRGNANLAGYMKVQPGAPHTVAVSL